jgi:hypothetical protein
MILFECNKHASLLCSGVVNDKDGRGIYESIKLGLTSFFFNKIARSK